jgi:rubrerythrin
MNMKLDEAIKVALDYEYGVHKVYLDAVQKTDDDTAKRIFKVLCREEGDHLAYLQSRLNEWQKTGKIKVKKLKTSIPAREAIEKGLQDLGKTVKPKPTRQLLELELLKKALEAEIKASNFYKEMVRTLDGEGQELFKRFVEIEEGHEAIVQAQINTVGNWGFWFDTPEFRLENE